VSADITKMYRQVLIAEEDRIFQLILWRAECNKPLEIYQLNTVSYGTSPAPFLAIRCLNELANNYKHIFPNSAETWTNSFYVVDLLTGADNLEDLLTIKTEVDNILKSGGFSLAKWHSNHKTFFSQNDKSLNLDELKRWEFTGKQLMIHCVFALSTIWNPFVYQKKHLVNFFQDIRPTWIDRSFNNKSLIGMRVFLNTWKLLGNRSNQI